MVNRDEAIKTFKIWSADYKVEEVIGKLMPWEKRRLDMFTMAIKALEKQQATKYKHIKKINWSKPKGDSYDFAIIDEVIAYDTQKED